MSETPSHRPIGYSNQPELTLIALVRLLARQAARSSLIDDQSEFPPPPDTESNPHNREK